MKVNKLPPFAPVDLRAWIEGTTEEARLVGTIRLLQWIEGPDAELPLALIQAGMPDVSPRHLKRILAKVKARGWLLTRRVAKGRLGRGAYTYDLEIEPLAFNTARAIINQRANLAPRFDGPTGQLELTKGPELTDLGATLAPPNIKEKDLRERPKRKTTAAEPQEGGKHPDQDATWADLKALWKEKTGGDLFWPGTGDQPPVKDFQAMLRAGIESLGRAELVRRWSNMLNDDFTKALSLRAFFADLAQWAAAPRKKGAASARTYHAPASKEHAPAHRLPQG